MSGPNCKHEIHPSHLSLFVILGCGAPGLTWNVRESHDWERRWYLVYLLIYLYAHYHIWAVVAFENLICTHISFKLAILKLTSLLRIILVYCLWRGKWAVCHPSFRSCRARARITCTRDPLESERHLTIGSGPMAPMYSWVSIKSLYSHST